MNGKQLKNSILQWAIQGKLVPQDLNDEPASILLERIRTEKERLIKEKKIKRSKNESIIYRGEDNSYYEMIVATGEVKCIDNEIPFEIPRGWEWCRLGTVIKLISGQDFPPEKYNDCGIGMPYITGASNIQNDDLVINRWTSTPSVLAITGDLLMVCKGSGVGKMCKVKIQQCHIARQIQSIRDELKVLNLKYIEFFLLSCLNDIISKAQGVIPGISRDVIQNLLFPFPPLVEQEKIVSKIEYLLPILEKYSISQDILDKLNAEINDKFRKSILQEAIQGKLVPQIVEEGTAQELLEAIQKVKQTLIKDGKLKRSVLTNSVIYKGDDNKYFEKIGNMEVDITEEIPFEIPKEWSWTRLSVIANLYTGNSISETEKKTKFTNVDGRDYIGTKDVGFDNTINYNNGIRIPILYEDKFKVANTQSVLICIEGGSAGRKIGLIDRDVCFGNKLCCLTPYYNISMYLFHYLQSSTFFEMFTSSMTGIIGGVSVNSLKQILIPLPPFHELRRIEAKCNQVLASIMSR